MLRRNNEKIYYWFVLSAHKSIPQQQFWSLVLKFISQTFSFGVRSFISDYQRFIFPNFSFGLLHCSPTFDFGVPTINIYNFLTSSFIISTSTYLHRNLWLRTFEFRIFATCRQSTLMLDLFFPISTLKCHF